METHIDRIPWLFVPFIVWGIYSIVICKKKKIAIRHLLIYPLFVGVSGYLFAPSCMCTQLGDFLVGTIGFSVLANLLIIIVVLKIEKKINR